VDDLVRLTDRWPRIENGERVAEHSLTTSELRHISADAHPLGLRVPRLPVPRAVGTITASVTRETSMDPNALPFDSDAMLDGLRVWVECESPTWDAAAVNRMLDIASRDLVIAGARIERVAGRMGFGDCVRATFPHPTADQPGILVMGHFDTVHPIGTLQKLPFRRDGDRAWGPAICDMKGGNYVALEAIHQLSRAAIATRLPVTVLFTSDEEVGSPSTRDLIEAEAARHRYVLVPEPARQDGGVVTGRYAIARYNLEATGRPSHAGARLAEGRSAIREMARKIIEIEDMTTEDCTFSVGVIHGGQWVNCVSTTCTAEALSMAKRQEDLDRGVARMLALSASSNDVQFRVTRGVTRPVWEPDAKVMALYERAREIAQALGFDIRHQSAGGGSDGNFTGAMGVPTLDGLGVQGAGAHTLNEHIVVESLASRGRLMAGLLAILD
jgi:glutamate carboxypeptidase